MLSTPTAAAMNQLSEVDTGKRRSEERSFTVLAEENSSRGMADLIRDQFNDAYSSLTFRGLLTPEEKRDLEVCNPFCAASKGGVTKSTAAVQRDICQQPNLDLSLLPPRGPLWTGSLPVYEDRGRPAASAEQYCPLPYSPNPEVNRSPKGGADQQVCGQLTIFYAGTVNVYNVSADKAKAILMMAGRTSGSPDSRTPSSTVSTPSRPLNSTPRCMGMKITSPQSPVAILSHTQSSQTLETAALQITKKCCIQRFLEKRNERIHGKSPYLRPA